MNQQQAVNDWSIRSLWRGARSKECVGGSIWGCCYWKGDKKKKLQLNASWEYKLDPEEVIKYGGITLIISENMQKKNDSVREKCMMEKGRDG